MKKLKTPEDITTWIACDCCRGQLEYIADNIGYKNVNKISRARLEQIAFVDAMLRDDRGYDNDTFYQIVNEETGAIIKKKCTLKTLIDWVNRCCDFCWAKSPEYPVMLNGTKIKIKILKGDK